MCNITEIKGNLFIESPKNCILAHCVSQDFHMGAGIVVEFKKRFGRVNELIQQNVKVGECCMLENNNYIIFYLITK